MHGYTAIEAEEAKRGQVGGPRSLLVYLAGPITGLRYEDALDWRTEVRERLLSSAPHVQCIDPMRAKKHLSGIEKIGPHGHAGALLSSHAVVARDLWDVDRSDVVLMNLSGAEEVSIGSMVELGRASVRNKFVIVVLPAEEADPELGHRNPHDHLFVHELASMVVNGLDEALAVIESM
jgi:nucleoside 2-deoxyribosyltransferase